MDHGIHQKVECPACQANVSSHLSRSFFARKFQRIVEVELARRAAEKTSISVDVKIEPVWKRVWTMLKALWNPPPSDAVTEEDGAMKQRGRNPVRPDMIRRVEGAPKLVDPSGWISEGVSEQQGTNGSSPQTLKPEHSETESSSGENTDSTEVEHKHDRPQTPEREQ